MSVCQVCDQQYEGKAEHVQIYAVPSGGWLDKIPVHLSVLVKAAGSDIKPVSIQACPVCQRRRWLGARIWGFLSTFAALYFVLGTESSDLGQSIINFIFTLVFFLIMLAFLYDPDGYYARQKTLQARQQGIRRRYITEQMLYPEL